MLSYSDRERATSSKTTARPLCAATAISTASINLYTRGRLSCYASAFRRRLEYRVLLKPENVYLYTYFGSTFLPFLTRSAMMSCMKAERDIPCTSVKAVRGIPLNLHEDCAGQPPAPA